MYCGHFLIASLCIRAQSLLVYVWLAVVADNGFKFASVNVTNVNPLYTNGFFLKIWHNKHGMVHSTYLWVSGYNFQNICFL